MTTKGTCSCQLHARNTSRVHHRSSWCYPTPRSQMTCTCRTSCKRCCPIIQLYDERIHVLPQQLHVIECVLEHIAVEIVDNVLGHIQNGEPDEERLQHLAHWCIQFDADEILGIHGCPGDHIVPMLLNDCLAFIPCGGELHLHSFQSSSRSLLYIEFANNLYRFFSTVVLDLARFSFNMFTYLNMNGVCLKGVYV